MSHRWPFDYVNYHAAVWFVDQSWPEGTLPVPVPGMWYSIHRENTDKPHYILRVKGRPKNDTRTD